MTIVTPIVPAVFGWEPSIGDPTLLGWLTTFGYLWAAYVCRRAYRAARVRRAGVSRLSSAWMLLCIAMLILGINKELDLQTLFSAIGKRLAHSEGWYEQRHLVQAWFIRGLALAAASGAVLGVWLMWRDWSELWLAAVGGGLIGAYVLMRAARFNNVHTLLGDTYLGMSLYWLIEVAGIVCIGGAARRSLRRRR